MHLSYVFYIFKKHIDFESIIVVWVWNSAVLMDSVVLLMIFGEKRIEIMIFQLRKFQLCK